MPSQCVSCLKSCSVSPRISPPLISEELDERKRAEKEGRAKAAARWEEEVKLLRERLFQLATHN
jgi:hypothetical protein